MSAHTLGSWGIELHPLQPSSGDSSNRANSVWWESDFRISLKPGLAVLFDLNPIDRTLALLSSCCRGLVEPREGEQAICRACGALAGVKAGIPPNAFLAPEASDRDLLAQWGELYVDPLTAVLLADALAEAITVIEQKAYAMWGNDTTLVSFDAVIEFTETVRPQLEAIGC